MKLSEFKSILGSADRLQFKLPGGKTVPRHFHITEAGLMNKHFMDCGGTVRSESVITMQLWSSYDFHHRLKPAKVLKILDKVQPLIGESDLEIEIEYQTDTIGKYGVEFDGKNFILTSKQTDCLAKKNCKVPDHKLAASQMQAHQNKSAGCCEPSAGCC